jgi:hypothetical protein
MMAELSCCRGNGDASDDSGYPALIPLMGRKMAARRRSRAGRWSLGRRKTAMESSAMAGKLGTCRCFRGRESPSEKERRERAGGGGASWCRWVAPGGSSVSRARAGGGNGDVQEASTQGFDTTPTYL